MKLTFAANLSRSELETIKSLLRSMDAAVHAQPNIHAALADESQEDVPSFEEVLAKAFTAVSFEYKAMNTLNNVGFMFKLTDKVDVNFSLEVSPELMEVWSEITMMFLNTGLPFINAVVGVYQSMAGEETMKRLAELLERVDTIVKPTSKTVTRLTGDDVL